jgi:hypothetical protein
VERAGWALVALGAALRLEHWLSGRSLWLDEASLALNLLDRGPAGLLGPLDHTQTAPWGFLLLEELALELFGPGERSLRFVPFVSSLVALVAFRRLAGTILTDAGALVATALAAVAGPLVHYAAELKPYSTDVAVAVLLTTGWIAAGAGSRGRAAAAALALGGAAAVWVSFPAALVIAGCALPPLVQAFRDGRRRRGAEILAAAAIPAASLGLWYVLAGHALLGESGRVAQFTNWYPPLGSPVDAARWLLSQAFEVFRLPAGLPLTGVAAFCTVLGAVALAGRRRTVLLQLALPLVLALVLAAARLYPFHGRLLLFSVPAILLLVGAGAGTAFAWGRHVAEGPPAAAARAAGPLLVALLLLHPLAFAADNLLASRGYGYEDLRPLLRTLEERHRRGDTLYLHGPERTPFLFYSRTGAVRVAGLDVVQPSGMRVDEYARDLRSLGGRGRVWILSSTAALADEEPAFRALLDTIGCGLGSHASEGVRLDLYDLTRPPGAGGEGQASSDGNPTSGRDSCR